MGMIAGSILLLCLIHITNANTRPEILNIFENVCEDIPIGGYAFTINATDAENDTLTYELSGSSASYFKVDPNNGVVTVQMQLDRESQKVLTLSVTVSDPRNRTPKDIIIILDDANDNKPIFQPSTYSKEVPENATSGTSLFKVHATDADTGSASLVKYSIDDVIPNHGRSLFSIKQNTGEVKLNGSLNYTGLGTFYQLTINATDGGGAQCGDFVVQSSIAFAFVTVLDVPDLDPQFIGLPYTASVKEGSPEGLPVLRVTAIGRDTGINDKMIYSIENSTAADLFNISENDGVISVMSKIDREVVGDAVTLIVKATEANPNIHGGEASTSASVEITIIDINDNRPEFYMCGVWCPHG